ncbi:MAG: WD repeat-containing protein 46, partial [Paramarteilia canceri]
NLQKQVSLKMNIKKYYKIANVTTRVALYDYMNQKNKSQGKVKTNSSNETTLKLTQNDILKQSSSSTVSKQFEIILPKSGPYNCKYLQMSPNSDKPLASILVSQQPLSAIDVSIDGITICSADRSKSLSFFDLRNYKMFQKIKLKNKVLDKFVSPVKNVQFSQNLVVGMSMDVIGIGHENGFMTQFVPESCIAFMDSRSQNLFANKMHRKDQIVSHLLKKIPHEVIDIETNAIVSVIIPKLRDHII